MKTIAWALQAWPKVWAQVKRCMQSGFFYCYACAIGSSLMGSAWADPTRDNGGALAGAQHNALAPAGPQAAHFADLWHLTVIICSIVFALVLAAFLYAIWRAPRVKSACPADLTALSQSEPGIRRSVIAATAISSALLMVLIVASAFADRAMNRLELADAVHIQVTAHQWWWEVRYDDNQSSNVFNTANEIHIPVGKPVILTLQSDDVIHSFWVPNLAGKKDLIPGRSTTLKLRADQAGEYRGQCTEFCGFQHAYMAFLVTADTPQDYEIWLTAQRQSAPEPSNDIQAHGKQVFLSGNCAMCHAVQGTTANAMRAPDLTHIASRKSLAAGTLPNTAENLANWISDPHKSKPGTNMPPTDLSGDDMNALVAYLGSLK